jgi:hypothetical protein
MVIARECAATADPAHRCATNAWLGVGATAFIHQHLVQQREQDVLSRLSLQISTEP